MEIANASKEYHSNNNLFFSCVYHVIFCPKYRSKVLIGEVVEEFKKAANEAARNGNFYILEMEVMPDHVHMIVDVNPKFGIFKAICRIKGTTSKAIRSKFEFVRKRISSLWTRSAFISSVGCVSLEVVRKYVENQKRNV